MYVYIYIYIYSEYSFYCQLICFLIKTNIIILILVLLLFVTVLLIDSRVWPATKSHNHAWSSRCNDVHSPPTSRVIGQHIKHYRPQLILFPILSVFYHTSVHSLLAINTGRFTGVWLIDVENNNNHYWTKEGRSTARKHSDNTGRQVTTRVATHMLRLASRISVI